MTPPPALRVQALATSAARQASGGVPPLLPMVQAQAEEAAAVLARAFHDDPVFHHLAPDPTLRPAALRTCFRTVLRYAQRHGAIDTTPGVDGVLVRLPPGAAPLPLGGLLRAGFASWPGAFGLRGFGRALRVLGAMDEAHHRVIRAPHWYFLAMGVEQDLRHQGLGTRLLERGLAVADAEALPVYGETFQPPMLPYLARLGFEVVAEADTPGGGPHLWAVLRRPRAPGAPQA